MISRGKEREKTLVLIFSKVFGCKRNTNRRREVREEEDLLIQKI